MKIFIINTHLNYPNWSEGRLNLTLTELAKVFFVERGHEVIETFVERGYTPEEELDKHLTADLVILQTPVNWFSAPWIYKKYVDEVFNAGGHAKILLDGDGRTREDVRRQYGTGGKMQGNFEVHLLDGRYENDCTRVRLNAVPRDKDWITESALACQLAQAAE